MITIDDFKKVELKVGKVLEAADHPNATKLLVLKVDVGEEQPRQLVAGIKAHYAAADLVGKNVIVVANLEPRPLRGVDSNGMLLATTDKATGAVIVLTTEKPASPGSGVS